MDLKKEIKVGDFVQYDNSEIVCNGDGVPLKVIEIKERYGRYCVFYDNGEFDFYKDVEKADPLLLELL